MQTSKITASQIKNRENCLKSSNESPDASYLYNIAIDSIKNNKQTNRKDAQAFFEHCVNKKNANAYFENCLDILEMYQSDEKLSQNLTNTLASKIIPYIIENESARESMAGRKLNDSCAKTLNEAFDKNHICDRIIANNKKLSNRFNFDKFIRENAYKPFENIILTCCDMIDTYTIPSYAKLNIALEELSYVLQKNLIDYDSARMVQLITEYFINFGNDEPEMYKKILTENYCISEEDLSDIKYFMEDFVAADKVKEEEINPYDISTVNVADKINNCIALVNQFKANSSKKIDDFIFVLDKCSDEPVNYQIQALPDLFDWIRNFGLELLGNNIFSYIDRYLENITEDINGNANQLEIYLATIELEMNKLRADTNFNTNSEEVNMYNKFYDILAKVQDNIGYIKANVKSVSEQKYEANRINCKKVMSLDEFKIFKFDNILKYTYLLNKKLKEKEKKFSEKVKGKVSELFKSGKKWLTEGYDISQIKEENIIDCISATNNFDHIIAVYEVSNEADILYVRQEFDNLCLELESSFVDKDIRVYCRDIDNLFEIHMADCTYINLTEAEMEERDKVFTETEQAYCGYLMSIAESIDEYYNINTSSLAEDFQKIENTLNADGIIGIIEASKYLVNLIPFARLEEMAELYAANHPMDYMGNTSIYQALESWKLEDSDLDMVVETVTMLRECVDNALLTEAEENKDSKAKQAVDNAKENIKKIEKTKLNFNSLRYAMEDLKTKSKDAGDKARQFSNTLNIYVEKFITAVKKLYTNDNREQIIKGSIIPSFHQLMGRLLVIGGASGVGGLAAGSAVAKTAGVAFSFSATGAIFTAVLATFVTIALSKQSTDKERALMLDEIEIELDICEKEMARAESNGQMKKYRALMYRRAKLVREYHRIKYDIKSKNYKDISAVRKKEN